MHRIGIVESRLKMYFYSLFNAVQRSNGKLLSTKVQTTKKDLLMLSTVIFLP